MLLGPGVHRRPRPRGRGVAPRDDAARSPGPRSAIAATPARSRPTAGSRCSTTTTTSTPPRWPGSSGKLTRYGDVADLLRADDDRLCVVGPGDEVRLEFDAKGLPPLPEGWTRSYVLRSFGYCKDADPFTATSDTVEPLPWRGMPAFPFGSDVKRPADPPMRRTSASTRPGPPGEGIDRIS